MKKKNLRRILKKYNFIILFTASFAAYMSVMGVQALSQTKKGNVPGQNVQTQPVGENSNSANEPTTAVEDMAALEQTTPEQTIPEATHPPMAPTDTHKGNFTTADISYLDGALFIGDSRTMTLSEYAGWDNTTFFVQTGLTIWNVMDENIANVGGVTLSVRNALETQTYDKIYIMLGINELGKGSPDSFCEQYRNVVNDIHSLQPQAVIYIESIMHVTQGKDDENYYINNVEVNARNEKIRTIADHVNIFWIDENKVFDAPGTGKLNPEFTSDGIHLKPKYINIWQDFLLKHVIIR